MNIIFQNSFEKSLDKAKDSKLRAEIAKAVKNILEVTSVSKIKNIKKLTGYKTAYRIKVMRDYRIGIVYQNNTIYIVDFAHRKDIYKKFP